MFKKASLSSLFFLLGTSLMQPVYSAPTTFSYTYKPKNANGTEDTSCNTVLQLYGHWDWDKRSSNNTFKGAFWLKGSGWAKVQGETDINAEPIKRLVDAGYIVFSPDYRGTNGGISNQNPQCANVDKEQQQRDIQAAFQKALDLGGFVDADHGWLVSGFSAGGHLAAWLSQHGSAAHRAKIRAVITVNSPVSLWHFWSDANGNLSPAFSDPTRQVELPDSGGNPITFGSVYSGGLSIFLDSHYLGPNTTANCNVTSHVGTDCYAEPPLSAAANFVMESTFAEVDRTKDLAPMFMITATKDWVVPPDSVIPVCEWHGDGPGTITFEYLDTVQKCFDPSYTSKQACNTAGKVWQERNYIGKCGSSESRIGLMEDVDHHNVPDWSIFGRAMTWAESSALDL